MFRPQKILTTSRMFRGKVVRGEYEIESFRPFCPPASPTARACPRAGRHAEARETLRAAALQQWTAFLGLPCIAGKLIV